MVDSRRRFDNFACFPLVWFRAAKSSIRDHLSEHFRPSFVSAVQSVCSSGFFRIESFSRNESVFRRRNLSQHIFAVRIRIYAVVLDHSILVAD